MIRLRFSTFEGKPTGWVMAYSDTDGVPLPVPPGTHYVSADVMAANTDTSFLCPECGAGLDGSVTPRRCIACPYEEPGPAVETPLPSPPPCPRCGAPTELTRPSPSHDWYLRCISCTWEED